MKLKGLTQKDVQRMSGGRITDGYVASITIGRASNLSVEKLQALAAGLGVTADDLFHVACGVPEEAGGGRKEGRAPDALMILETVQKAVVSPDVTEILHAVVRMSVAERADVMAYIKSNVSAKTKARSKTKHD